MLLVNQLNGFGVRPGYLAQGVTFDGTNDYLSRGAGLTGAADSKLFTFSVWYKPAVDNVTHRLIGLPAATGRFALNKGSNAISNAFQVFGANAAGTTILNVVTASAILAGTGYHHVMASFNMANTSNRHLYLDDASSLSVNTYTNDAVDFTVSDWGVGARPTGEDKCNGDMADLMLWTGVYVDLSQQSNRRLFISPNGKPVDPSVAARVLGSPIIGLSGPVPAWHTNKGYGGGFTLNGTIDASSTRP